MRIAALASLLLALGGAACGNNTQTPTSADSTTSVPTTRLFTGALPAKGFAFFSFTASQAGTASAMLASVTVASTGRTLTVPLGMGLGIPSGIDCAQFLSKTVTPALVPQLTYLPQKGTYCIRVYDTGSLTADVTFAVRISYP